MEHHPSPHLPEYSPDNERAAQLEKDRQYLLFLLANDLGYDTRDISISSEHSDIEASVNPAHYMITIPPRQECQQPAGQWLSILISRLCSIRKQCSSAAVQL